MKKKFGGGAPQGGVVLYSGKITSKVGGIDCPVHEDEKSRLGCCCTKFRLGDIEHES